MKKNAYAQVLRLWQAYQAIKIRSNDGNIVTLSPGYIITACNPESRVCSAKQNRLKTEKLQRYLESHDISAQPVLVGDLDFNWVEPSFCCTLDEKRAFNLARLYQQNAIYQIKDNELWLIPVLLKRFPEVSLGPLKNFSI